jgi:hypothetical protein
MSGLRALPLLACLVTVPAAAEPWACVFTAECPAAGPCAAGRLELRVIAADHAGDLFLSTDTGDRPVARLTAPGAMPSSYAGTGGVAAARMLTVAADRTAILTVHGAEGRAGAVTHFGTCEELS